MTDKEFDRLLRDALNSEDVPEELNATLLEKVKKKKNFKLIRFTKSASLIAAVFICGIAILDFYSNDMDKFHEQIPAVETKTSTEEKETGSKEIAEPVPVTEKKTETAVVREEKKAVPSPKEEINDIGSPAPSEDTAAPAVFTEEATEQAEVQAEESTFKMRRAVPPSLSSIFNDGYDYKAVINKKISEQISSFPNSDEYTFSEISENESFTLNEENVLTIIFAPGEILPEEHGEQFFTIGTVANGIIAE